MMHFLSAIIGIIFVGLALLEGFETIVMPRTAIRNLRVTRLVYKHGWTLWTALSSKISPPRREGFLSVFGPLSLIALLALWAFMLIIGFALLQWAQGNAFTPSGSLHSMGGALYLSGTTLFTLGFGDITPLSSAARMISVTEAGVGLGFLAIVIGYLPTLYQAFSRREIVISMLDSRASSPPTAAEILRRFKDSNDDRAFEQFLKDWEIWCADVLESHLSYPVLAYYRSQHDRQSWVSALTAVMDTCSLILVDITPGPTAQASHTFAMGRHAMVDLSIVFGITPNNPVPDRLDKSNWVRLVDRLHGAGITFHGGLEDELRLRARRLEYEPHLNGLAQRFQMPLPPWIYAVEMIDNWRSDPWEPGELSHLQ